MTCPLVFFIIPRGAQVARLVERWKCDSNVAGLNLGKECPCQTISLVSAPYAVPVVQMRLEIVVPSQFVTASVVKLDIPFSYP